jgi:two-component sensor histidine kinase
LHTHHSIIDPLWRLLARSLRTLSLILCVAGPVHAEPDTALFNAFIRRGNQAYAQKASYASFTQSLRYFDSATVIAEQSGNILLRARATAARGRIYDAWNREPQKTVDLFDKAAALYFEAGEEEYYFYLKHLLAHAYDKMRDSVGATGVLREMIRELNGRDTATLHRYGFLCETALIATQVRAYTLADSILNRLTRRSWITNDPASYNYLDHYYLTQSRLDVYWRKKSVSPYLDSLAAAYARVRPMFDRVYYASELANLYGTVGDYATAYRYRTAQGMLTDSLTLNGEMEQMQRSLIASEAAAEHRKQQYERMVSRARTAAIWVLSGLLAVITVLSIYLFRRNRKYRVQSQHLQAANTELDTQVGKVEVLNKEIQHRVKNNLYTIYSLLHMQQDSTDNEEVIAHLEAARLRVESVAALHDHLQAGTDAVDFGAYIKTLINKVVSCYAERRSVVTHMEVEPVSLPINTCFALSLILNEWITNSIKYAVTQNDVLTMDVRIRNVQDGVCIDYSDDGTPPARRADKEGLGTSIVRLLTAQVRGTLTTAAGGPYCYNLCIPHGKQD